MEEGARIGHLTVVKGVRNLKMGKNASIGRLNWISAFPLENKNHFQHIEDRQPDLILKEESAITHRHILDCTESITIGSYTTVAGYASQFITHSIDVAESRQGAKPITIGDYCFIGTNVVILGGATLPSRSILGAKSLLNKAFEEELMLYGGVAAKPLQKLTGEERYFHREKGFVN